MHSVRIELAKLIFVCTRITYQATGVRTTSKYKINTEVLRTYVLGCVYTETTCTNSFDC